jgi:hypothetical protein
MARFMMVYKGEATDMSMMTEDEVSAVMAAWGVWIQNVGPALVDVGTPFGPGVSVVDDGSTGAAVSLTGYSIVEADSMNAARAFANNHPFLSEGKGNFAVDVYELMPVPMMD